MTPDNVRQALSQLLVFSVATETMRNIPSMVSNEALDSESFVEKLTAAFPKAQFQYKPNNTLGMLVDRVAVELSTDNPSEEDLYKAYETVMADEHTPVGVTVRNMGRSLAQSLSGAYRMFTDTIIPTAEGVVGLVTQRLATESALGGGGEVHTNITSFNWGLLDDPMVVQESMALGIEHATAFLPEQPVRLAHVNGCHVAALRFASKTLPSETRVALDAALAEQVGEGWGGISRYTSAFGSAEGFNYQANHLKGSYHTSRGALEAAKELTAMLSLSEHIDTLVHSKEEFSGAQLREASANFGKAVRLMAAALQAARTSLYFDTVIMAADATADHAKSIVFNSDLAPLMNANGIDHTDAVSVVECIASEGRPFGDRGIDMPTLTGIKARSLERKARRDQEALEKRLAGESVEFGQLIRKTLQNAITEFKQSYKTNPRAVDVDKAIAGIAARAVAQEGSLFDDTVRLNVQMLDNPALTRLFTCLEAASAANPADNEDLRTAAFTRYAVEAITDANFVR